MARTGLKGLISDTVSRIARLDATSHSIQTIDYAHHEIHSGDSFHAWFNNTTANQNSHRSAIAFTLPSPGTGKYFHLTGLVSSSDPAEIFLIEAPGTLNPDEGTQDVAVDRNRATANTSTCLSIETVPTVGSYTTFTEAQLVAAGYLIGAGIILDYAPLVGGSGQKAVGGVARSEQEWMLNEGETYIMIIQNTDTNTNTHGIHLNWYEHTTRD
jgi:hypothetical protein